MNQVERRFQERRFEESEMEKIGNGNKIKQEKRIVRYEKRVKYKDGIKKRGKTTLIENVTNFVIDETKTISF